MSNAGQPAAGTARPAGEAPDPTVAAVVRAQTGLAWSRAKSLCTEGRVSVNGRPCLDPAARVAPDSVVAIDRSARKPAAGPLPGTAVVWFDHDLVVLDKPAGMLSVADEAGNRDTLADYARTLLRRIDPRGADAKLGVVHRLDRDTSGLIVFARTAAAKRALAERFRAHEIERIYHAIAHGTVRAARIDSHLVLDRGDGLRGSHGSFRRTATDLSPAPPEARRSVTHVRPLAALNGATLVECRLETGRQHQIRIHLSEFGHPLVGERVYIRDYAGRIIDSPRPMLHARTLGFAHPRTGKPLAFESEPPEDFRAMLEALR